MYAEERDCTKARIYRRSMGGDAKLVKKLGTVPLTAAKKLLG